MFQELDEYRNSLVLKNSISLGIVTYNRILLALVSINYREHI